MAVANRVWVLFIGAFIAMHVFGHGGHAGHGGSGGGYDDFASRLSINVTVRSFPSNLTAMVFGYSAKANFIVDNENEIAKAPKVEFGSPLAKPQAEAQGTAK